jgi:hypothetical protein
MVSGHIQIGLNFLSARLTTEGDERFLAVELHIHGDYHGLRMKIKSN